jgi:hypothetical protein
MWILYGVEKFLVGDNPDGSVSTGMKRDALATFDSEQEGLNYVERSKLPTYSKMAPLATPENQFKDDSLLYGFHLAQLEPKNALPHSPMI